MFRTASLWKCLGKGKAPKSFLGGTMAITECCILKDSCKLTWSENRTNEHTCRNICSMIYSPCLFRLSMNSSPRPPPVQPLVILSIVSILPRQLRRRRLDARWRRVSVRYRRSATQPRIPRRRPAIPVDQPVMISEGVAIAAHDPVDFVVGETARDAQVDAVVLDVVLWAFGSV